MEFPDLGETCQVNSCGRLDFLPVKCYACQKKFCNDHWQYDSHQCTGKHSKDVQVPVCPLCDKPVPTAKGVSPDITVSAHIDRDCQSDPAVAKRNKVYVNRCSVKKCKQKEMIKIECDKCRQTYCLKHRHPEDHQCQNKPLNVPPKATAAASKAAQAAMSRQQQSSTPQGTSSVGSSLRSTASSATNRLMNGQSSIRSFFQSHTNNPNGGSTRTNESMQRGMTEDEALAQALQESLNQQQGATNTASSGAQNRIRAPRTREEQDLMLAQALAESQQETNRNNQQNTTSSGDGEKSCAIS